MVDATSNYQVYTVEKGTTLWSVAKEICKKTDSNVTNADIVLEMRRLAKINGAENFDVLGEKFRKIGNQIKISETQQTNPIQSNNAVGSKVKLELPKLNTSNNSPAPEMKAPAAPANETKTPSVKLELPKLNTSNNSPAPEAKTPAAPVSESKTPKVKLELPKLNTSNNSPVPEMKAPAAPLSESKIPSVKLELPKLNTSNNSPAPEAKTPAVPAIETKTPSVKLELPKLNTSNNSPAPEMKAPAARVRASKTPKVKLELPKLMQVTNPINTTSKSAVVQKAEELLKQNASEGNGKNLLVSQGRNEAWCANTVNYIYDKAYGKTPFGLHSNGTYKASVSELKQWGINKERFNSAKNEEQVKAQLKTMKSGDVIIWKSPYKCKIEGLGTVTRHASHTGIVESVSQDGVVSIIEGNANAFKKNSKGEYLLVKNKAEGVNGAQDVGDRQEINRYDAVLKKRYNAKNLVESGYSGYINMQNLNL